MSTVVWLGVYLAMTVGGILTVILHLLYAAAPSSSVIALGAVLAAGGAALIWAECRR
jgi:hypothetical protein